MSAPHRSHHARNTRFWHTTFTPEKAQLTVINRAMAAVFATMAVHSAFAAPPAPPPVQAETQTQSQTENQGEGGPVIRQLSRPQNVLAQPLPVTDPLLQQERETKEEQPGLKVGSFRAFPQVTLSEVYDDNIYATRAGETTDLITSFTPSVLFKSEWERHRLNFDFGASSDQYADHSSENVTDYWLGADGRYDLGPTSNLFGNLRFSQEHEDRASPDADLAGTEPTLYTAAQAQAGASFKAGQAGVRVGASVEELDFKNVSTQSGGVINNDLRDRKLYSVGARVGFPVSAKSELFLLGLTDQRRYVQAINYGGVNRDSDGYRLAVGFKTELSPTVKGEAFLGQLRQDYDAATLADVSRPYFGGSLKWQVDNQTKASFNLDRALNETTLAQASSYLETSIGARVERNLSRDLSVDARASFSRDEYQGYQRTDKLISAALGAQYYLTESVYLGGEYRFISRASDYTVADEQVADYYKNQIWVTLGYTPGRKRPDVPVAASSLAGIFLATADTTGLKLPADLQPTDYSGFYLGLQTGYGALATETKSPRGGGGSDEDDFANTGVTNGLFGGYGFMKNRWYFGLEAEAETSNTRWYHHKDKAESKTMWTEKKDGYGIGLRVGYALDGGLVYGRIGVVRTTFHTYDAENQFLAGAYDRDQTLTGDRYGVGTDIPASQRMFVRMDYTYTHYGNYAVPYQSGGGPAYTSEDFDNAESLFRVGLGWRFGGQSDGPAPQVAASTVSGFYAGAQVGNGMLGTKLDAIHRDGGEDPGPPYPLHPFTGDFGNTGSSGGMFAGWGTTVSRVYLGLEMDAERSTTEWLHTRTTGGGGGRDFSVQKRGGYGASMRVGYVLDNGALLYGRVGAVRSKFNTIYNKGANADSYVDRDDTVAGRKVGLGAEVPASRDVFVRFDYSVTDYDSYNFVTTQGGGTNADEPNFKNRDSVFQLGLGLRF